MSALMRCKDGEPFEYWIGMFMPANTVVPEGFAYVDFPQSLNEILQILSVTILQKTPVNVLFSQEQWRNQMDENRNQLGLFEL